MLPQIRKSNLTLFDLDLPYLTINRLESLCNPGNPAISLTFFETRLRVRFPGPCLSFKNQVVATLRETRVSAALLRGTAGSRVSLDRGSANAAGRLAVESSGGEALE